MASYELLPARERPSAVILASATGFSAEARAFAEGSGNPSVILMGGRADGGWDVSLPPVVRKSAWAKLLELETQSERLRRLLYHLNENASLVDSRGISMAVLSEKLGVNEAEAERVVRQACRTQPRLMTVVHEGRTHVCRTPLAEEGHTMSIWSRIRRLLRLKPTTAERVRDLTAKRVQIEQQRAEVDEKIDKFEAHERQLLEQGAEATSAAVRKQFAGKLMRTRRELGRHRAQAQMFTQQIDVIGTHIHHLTLAEQGKRLELPSAEDLTQEAAQAEQVMAETAANAELAASIEVAGETPMMEEEEAAIFAEFDQVASKTTPQPAEPEATEPAQPPPAESKPERAAPTRASSPPRKERDPAGPEAG